VTNVFRRTRENERLVFQNDKFVGEDVVLRYNNSGTICNQSICCYAALCSAGIMGLTAHLIHKNVVKLVTVVVESYKALKNK
jgi:hypothetical protein